MTKREFFEVVKRVAEDMQGNDSEFVWGNPTGDEKVEKFDIKNTDIIAHCEKEIKLLDNRATKKSAKLENTETLDTIAQIVADNSGADCTRIAQAMGWTTQKATPYLKKLAENGRIKVEKVKGRNTYTIA